MGGKASRTKGHNWEREVAKILREIWPDAQRQLQYRSGSDAGDVMAGPLWVECKRGKKTNIKAALRQAQEAGSASGKLSTIVDCGDGALSVSGPLCLVAAVCKDDREDPTITMRLSDFTFMMRLYAGARKAQNPNEDRL